ncbi:hypothetical protein BSK43_027480 [Rhizobium sp. P44RR-XXIV]|nr:hypothetical protein BSK43_027480 [Rhizobium sp. P44RR-XXIV]
MSERISIPSPLDARRCRGRAPVNVQRLMHAPVRPDRAHLRHSVSYISLAAYCCNDHKVFAQLAFIILNDNMQRKYGVLGSSMISRLMKQSLFSAEIRSTFVRYLVTGGLAAIIDVSVFSYFNNLQFGVLAAATIGFVVACLFNYITSSIFVFAANWRSATRALSFLAAALVGLSINVSITFYLSAYGIWPVLAKIIGIGIAFIANFSMNSLIVFRRR